MSCSHFNFTFHNPWHNKNSIINLIEESLFKHLFLGMSLSQASVFAQSSLILNYSHHILAKPNKSCFIPEEMVTFRLSNDIKHRAM